MTDSTHAKQQNNASRVDRHGVVFPVVALSAAAAWRNARNEIAFSVN